MTYWEQRTKTQETPEKTPLLDHIIEYSVHYNCLDRQSRQSSRWGEVKHTKVAVSQGKFIMR